MSISRFSFCYSREPWVGNGETAVGRVTGLDPLDGHRVAEIGAVKRLSGRGTVDYLNRHLCPERAVPADALAVHGLSAEFLADKPLFGAIADELLAFVSGAPSWRTTRALTSPLSTPGHAQPHS